MSAGLRPLTGLDYAVMVVVLIAGSCALWACVDGIRTFWRYVRHQLRSLRWIRSNRRYMAHWRE